MVQCWNRYWNVRPVLTPYSCLGYRGRIVIRIVSCAEFNEAFSERRDRQVRIVIPFYIKQERIKEYNRMGDELARQKTASRAITSPPNDIGDFRSGSKRIPSFAFGRI